MDLARFQLAQAGKILPCESPVNSASVEWMTNMMQCVGTGVLIIGLFCIAVLMILSLRYAVKQLWN